jgi:hypothetical protein
MSWAIFWAILSQTYLATLLGIAFFKISKPRRVCNQGDRMVFLKILPKM